MKRFKVFGCRPSDGVLVETETDMYTEAAAYWAVNQYDGFKARVWDNWQRGFVVEACLRMMTGRAVPS